MFFFQFPYISVRTIINKQEQIWYLRTTSCQQAWLSPIKMQLAEKTKKNHRELKTRHKIKFQHVKITKRAVHGYQTQVTDEPVTSFITNILQVSKYVCNSKTVQLNFKNYNKENICSMRRDKRNLYIFAFCLQCKIRSIVTPVTYEDMSTERKQFKTSRQICKCTFVQCSDQM